MPRLICRISWAPLWFMVTGGGLFFVLLFAFASTVIPIAFDMLVPEHGN